jgi:hypothetical protein
MTRIRFKGFIAAGLPPKRRLSSFTEHPSVNSGNNVTEQLSNTAIAFDGWPRLDLRFVSGKGPESSVYGFLPPGFFRMVRGRFLAINREKKAAFVGRTE